MELTGGTTDDKELENTVYKVVQKHFKAPISTTQMRVVKTGVYITAYIYTDDDDITVVRENILRELNIKYDNIRLLFCR